MAVATDGHDASTIEPTDLWSGSCETARSDPYEGYSKHDGLNSPVPGRAWPATRGCAGWRPSRSVIRSPVDIRPLVGVRKARNAKGLSLFSRALLARHRMTGSADDAAEARELLDWLIAHPAPGFEHLCWGYPYPWQDVGFFAPRDFPNRVVTSFVGQALLDGYETLQDEPLPRRRAGRRCGSCWRRRRRCIEDDDRRCLSYVPDATIDWIVMDVSALAGALAARLGALTGDARLITEGGRLVRYVVSKQTDDGAWYLRRAAVGQPHHARQLPHRLHPRRDPGLRAGRRQRRVRDRRTSAASSSTSAGCSSPTARPGS